MFTQKITLKFVPTSYWSPWFENRPLRDFGLRLAALDCKQLFILCSSEHFYLFWLKNTFVFLFQVGERIRVILDCDDNTLAFERNYEFLGVAFRGKFLKFITNCVSNFLYSWVQEAPNSFQNIYTAASLKIATSATTFASITSSVYILIIMGPLIKC